MIANAFRVCLWKEASHFSGSCSNAKSPGDFSGAFLCLFDAFSLREPVSTSLENAMDQFDRLLVVGVAQRLDELVVIFGHDVDIAFVLERRSRRFQRVVEIFQL